MIRFLFWNVCGVASSAERKGGGLRPLLPDDRRFIRLRRLIKVIAGREKVDVVVLAESPFEGQLGLTGFTEAQHTLKPNKMTRTRLEIYHRDRIAMDGFQVVERAVFLETRVVDSGQSLLLVCAHLDSPLALSAENRRRRVETLPPDIRDREESINLRNTILVGDLNYDPHDAPVTDAYGLNAVGSKTVARTVLRRANRNKFPYFYNPMWIHLTDAKGVVPGSYYRKTSDVDCRVWYLPDQVMIRPSLIRNWNDDSLRVLTNIGTIRLIDGQDRPHRKMASDHLPIAFALDI